MSNNYIMYTKNGKIQEYQLEGKLKKTWHDFSDYYLKELNKSWKDFATMQIEEHVDAPYLKCFINPNVDYIEFNNISFEAEKNPMTMIKFILPPKTKAVFKNCNFGILYTNSQDSSVELIDCKASYIVSQKLENFSITENQKFEEAKVRELPIFSMKSSLKKNQQIANISVDTKNFYMDSSLSFGKIRVNAENLIYLKNLLGECKEMNLKGKKIQMNHTNVDTEKLQIITKQLELEDTIIQANSLFMDPIFIQMDEKSKLTSPNWKINHSSLLSPSEKCEISLQNEDLPDEKIKKSRRNLISSLKGIESYYRNHILEEEKDIRKKYNELINAKKKELSDLENEYKEKEVSVMKKIKKTSIKHL